MVRNSIIFLILFTAFIFLIDYAYSYQPFYQLIRDRDNDTKINTEESVDSDSIVFYSGGSLFGTWNSTQLLINPDNANHDFVVNGDTEDSILRADAATDSVGIGIASPVDKLHIHEATDTLVGIQFTHSGTGSTATDGSKIFVTGDNFRFYNYESDGEIRFTANDGGTLYDALYIQATNRRVGINTSTPSAYLDVETLLGSVVAVNVTKNGAASEDMIVVSTPSDADASPTYALRVYDSASLGGVQYASSTTLAYTGTSDMRLKENFREIPNPVRTVMKLRPSLYEWKESGDTDIGFGAQETQPIYPYAVHGDPDKDEDMEPMTIELGKFVPLLTSALQKTISKLNDALRDIEQLKKEVAILKGGSYSPQNIPDINNNDPNDYTKPKFSVVEGSRKSCGKIVDNGTERDMRKKECFFKFKDSACQQGKLFLIKNQNETFDYACRKFNGYEKKQPN